MTMTTIAAPADGPMTAYCPVHGTVYWVAQGCPKCRGRSCAAGFSPTPDTAVIAIWPVTEVLRADHHLPAEASAAVVELYQGTVHVCCTDIEAVNGTEKAARAWAEGTGAAYAGRGAA